VKFVITLIVTDFRFEMKLFIQIFYWFQPGTMICFSGFRGVLPVQKFFQHSNIFIDKNVVM
jgi:hypothetical protein